MSGDVLTILFSWLLLSLFGLASLPLVMLSIGRVLPDKGWAFARIIGWLLVAVPIWFVAHLGLPINTSPGIWLVLLGWLGVSTYLFFKYGEQLLPEIKSIKKLIVVEESLFFFGLVFLSLVRGFAPDINGLEKFMDAGLIVNYLQSPTLPIKDMWLAGYTFNYYTFGHFLGAVATQVMRQPIDLSYNLLLGFMMGLTLIQSFGLIITFLHPLGRFLKKSSKQAQVWPTELVQSIRVPSSTLVIGAIGALLVVFGGNMQHVWYWLTNKTFVGYWYPDATRFIPNTIHEFPAYSFIVSDLHAHVWSMILVSLLLLLLWLFVRALLLPFLPISEEKSSKQSVQKAIGRSDSSTKRSITAPVSKLLNQPVLMAAPVGFLLGLIASTSTWDTLIYGMFLIILGILALAIFRLPILKPLVLSAVVMAVSLAIGASPWWLSFESISEGARLVTERSEVWRFLTLWTGHIIMSAVALVTAVWLWLRHKPDQNRLSAFFISVMVLTAWLLLILPELFYMKDIYPGHPRANTMFKPTFQAFILMNLTAAWALGTLWQKREINRWMRIVGITIVGLIMTLMLVYPYFGYRDYYGLKVYKGLDGLQFLQMEMPDDYAAINWMRSNITGQPTIVEAVGESYTTFSRVSAFTGFPTILGWRVHEWLWRGSFDIPGARTPEVETIYNQPTSYEAKQKLNQYGVEYVFVGSKEREAYPNLDLAGLKSLGDVVFEEGETFVVRR